MASYANLYVDQGSDYSTYVFVEDSNGDALDLSSINVTGQVRRTYQSETAYDFTVTKTDTINGQINLALDAQTTGSMFRGRYVYDVYAEDTIGDTHFKILEGILEVIPRVTR